MPIDEGSCGETKARVSKAGMGVARVADAMARKSPQWARCVVRGGWNGHDDETSRGASLKDCVYGARDGVDSDRACVEIRVHQGYEMTIE